MMFMDPSCWPATDPLHVKKSKELDDNSPTKNDIKDAKVIAQLVKDGRYAVRLKCGLQQKAFFLLYRDSCSFEHTL
ncbi:hypothetical protein ASL11_23095 [Paenibacillus sp. Soil750]|nr:hypothetical protein ASL11_23095 [Paenibacillus sp. Soil750]